MIIYRQLWALLRYFDRAINDPGKRFADTRARTLRYRTRVWDIHRCSASVRAMAHRTNHQKPCRTETVAPVLCE
jgi:hypothetical protein